MQNLRIPPRPCCMPDDNHLRLASKKFERESQSRVYFLLDRDLGEMIGKSAQLSFNGTLLIAKFISCPKDIS